MKHIFKLKLKTGELKVQLNNVTHQTPTIDNAVILGNYGGIKQYGYSENTMHAGCGCFCNCSDGSDRSNGPSTCLNKQKGLPDWSIPELSDGFNN
jgi:hypothetical protein